MEEVGVGSGREWGLQSRGATGPKGSESRPPPGPTPPPAGSAPGASTSFRWRLPRPRPPRTRSRDPTPMGPVSLRLRNGGPEEVGPDTWRGGVLSCRTPSSGLPPRVRGGRGPGRAWWPRTEGSLPAEATAADSRGRSPEFRVGWGWDGRGTGGWLKTQNRGGGGSSPGGGGQPCSPRPPPAPGAGHVAELSPDAQALRDAAAGSAPRRRRVDALDVCPCPARACPGRPGAGLTTGAFSG